LCAVVEPPSLPLLRKKKMNQLRVKVGKDEEAKRGRDGRRGIAMKK
jgi:hypothetical protein